MKRLVVSATVAAVAVAVALAPPANAGGGGGKGHEPRVIGDFTHLVVVYQENHSFDNLYGTWGKVGRDRVDGLANAPASRTTQVAQDGTAYGCLLQNDVNLTSPPLAASCSDPAHGVASSAFTNAPFTIDSVIPASATTCPVPGVFAPNGVLNGSGQPGGCTRDLVHRFYQEQYQLDGGKQDRYVTGSDAVGLTMGVYDTKALPIYQYLHGKGAPNYVVADRFFQAAFGGSFLNHQYLVTARAPIDTSAGTGGAHEGQHSVVDTNGFPNPNYALYKPTVAGVADRALTQACGLATTNPAALCGDYAVNTVQPATAPFGGGLQIPLVDDAQYPTIGDRLSDKGISWAWYSGGWDNAAAGHPDPLFQYHHQPFTYYKNYAAGTPGRAEHLRDETEFLAKAKAGTLPTVSFVKPLGEENEHPGYTSESNGSNHLVDLVKAITNGPDGDRTLIVVTYDEFGGQWDHVPPPGQGSTTKGVSDAFGPGTRIPALVISSGFDRSGVDHTVYDTTSILATIEHGLHVKPVDSRDAKVADLRNAVRIGTD